MSDVRARPAGPAVDWHPEPELINVRDEAMSRTAMREAGAQLWEAALDYLYGHALDRAMGEPVDYDGLRSAFFGPSGRPAPAPRDPVTLTTVLEEFSTRVAPHTVSAYHPRSFGYFTPPPLLASVAGEVLAQVAQQGIDVWHAGPIGAFVEEEVLDWLCGLVGYGEGSFGILTSGGVMANFIAMALIRDVHLSRVRGAPPARGRALEGVRVYASDQTHFSIGRALDELGFPPETLAVVPAGNDFRLRGAPVEEAIRRDRAAGLLPVAIAAVAGSTNTGAVDAVGELADLADREGLWLHVDAAYGAAARLSARDAGRVPDLDRARSVTVDPHKWLFQAYDIGGLMVREREVLGEAFGGRRPEYYRAGHERNGTDGSDGAGRGTPGADDGHGSADQLNFWRLGFEGTRRWRALKLWLSWKHVGSEGFGRLVEANNDLAVHLAARIAASGDFEALPADPPLSVVCFRHLPGGQVDLDAHQDRLQAALEASGEGWLTTTRLRGSTYLRAGILNTQSTTDDIDDLLELLRRLAADA